MASKWPKAWRYLSQKQKREYAAWRHGVDQPQGSAFYWLIQEIGNMATGVKPQGYIERAVTAWKPQAETKVRRYLQKAWDNDVT